MTSGIMHSLHFLCFLEVLVAVDSSFLSSEEGEINSIDLVEAND